MASISLDQLYTYHSMDRKIFSRLTINFKRDPAETLIIFALWLWLEDRDFPSIIPKLLGLDDPLVDSIADEAVLCLECLGHTNPPVITVNGGMPLTATVMNRDISLRMIYENKYSAISGIMNFLNTICNRIFTDILQQVLGEGSFISLNRPLNVSGFPHPVFGDITVMPDFIHGAEFPGGVNGVWAWHANNNTGENDKTMFLTFSRGFPVTELEVRELFTNMFGENSVERVLMQENTGSSDHRPLFARVVFDSILTIDRVLIGRRIAKFRINGKHIWARKYEPRDQSA